MKFAKKHQLDVDYAYGPLDQIVFVGETTYAGGPEHYFKNGWPAFGKTPVIKPGKGTVSNVRSTSTNPRVSIAYAWFKSNSTQGVGWLYMVWCRRGFEYRPYIEAVKGQGAANDEVVMVSIDGHHVLAARKITRDDKDSTGSAILGEVVENPKSKLKKNYPHRYAEEIENLSSMATPLTGLLDDVTKSLTAWLRCRSRFASVPIEDPVTMTDPVLGSTGRAWLVESCKGGVGGSGP